MTYGKAAEPALYGIDLAFIHHTGFGTFAEQAAPALLAHIRDAGFDAGLIVDLACGSGIWPAHATQAGYDVLGIDGSPAMIDLARAVAPQAKFIVASVHSAELPECVAVTAIGEGIVYLADGETHDVPRLLRRISDALVLGGLFIFDVIEMSPEAPMNYASTREEADWRVHVEVVEEPHRRQLQRTITTTRELNGERRTSVELHRLRTVQRDELLEQLRAAGFSVQVTRSYGDLELAPRRLAFIAQKRAVEGNADAATSARRSATPDS